jgi:hypothetical protein
VEVKDEMCRPSAAVCSFGTVASCPAEKVVARDRGHHRVGKKGCSRCVPDGGLVGYLSVSLVREETIQNGACNDWVWQGCIGTLQKEIEESACIGGVERADETTTPARGVVD